MCERLNVGRQLYELEIWVNINELKKYIKILKKYWDIQQPNFMYNIFNEMQPSN